MNTYLDGYLASIPSSEYGNIISFLQQHATSKLNISNDEFMQLLDELTKERTAATQIRTTDSNEKPVDTYNDFFNRVSVDLVYLFKVINALYKAIDSYSYLSSSYLSDIKGELDKLNTRIKELKARKEYDNNTIIISETFKDTGSFELFNKSTEYLFTDRDGAILEPVELVHNNTDDMITLKVAAKKDLLHNQNGKPLGMIKVIDYRGIPIDTYATSIQAIDNSETSYWDCSVISKDVINVPMDSFEQGGAYIKFKIHLAKTNRISEISLTPFCVYPVEIVSIKIDDRDIIQSLVNPNNISTDTMTFNIPPVSSDEIEIVLRQKNYIYDVVNRNQKVDEANELWSAVIDGTKESYVNITGRPTDYKDADIYKRYMARKEKEVTAWNEKFIREAE